MSDAFASSMKLYTLIERAFEKRDFALCIDALRRAAVLLHRYVVDEQELRRRI
jgi:hypothetical protein